MASKFSRVNGRGHRTISHNARCECCKQVYTNWKFIGKDLKCFKCHGVDEQDQTALIQFIQENKEAN